MIWKRLRPLSFFDRILRPLKLYSEFNELLPGNYGKFYSVRRATTGSFLAALPDGISPATNVSSMLTPINMSAVFHGRNALRLASPESA